MMRERNSVWKTNPMVKIGRIIMESALASYFTLAYAFSWLIWVPTVIYYLGQETEQIPGWLFILGWIGSFGPTISAIVLAGIESGFEGIRGLLSRFTVWRVGARWYVFIILFPAVVRIASIGIYALVTGVRPEPDLSQLYMAVPIYLMAVPFGPLAEETGWRGYALPRLQASRGALGSGLILGLLWTLWHAPGFLVPGMALPPVPLDWVVVLNYALRVVSISVLFVWVYNNTKGSLLVSTLFHAALNSMPTAVNRVFFAQQSVDLINWMSWLAVGFNWMTVVIIILLFGKAGLKPAGKP